jgi:hypothetical protein
MKRLMEWLGIYKERLELKMNLDPDDDDDKSRVERLIRDDFDHFDDVYLRGDANWLLRQRTFRLCEDVVRHVLEEIK